MIYGESAPTLNHLPCPSPADAHVGDEQRDKLGRHVVKNRILDVNLRHQLSINKAQDIVRTDNLVERVLGEDGNR